MKRLFYLLVLFSVILSLSACYSGMSVSNKMYKEISEYVTENMDTFSPKEENEFYNYNTTGLSIGGVYYGYYYSSESELLLPGFYSGNDLGKINNDIYEDDGGVYFGKPNNGTDWCFIKKISVISQILCKHRFRCKTEQNIFKAGAAEAVSALSTK